MVFGSSTGWLVFYAALVFGARSVGYELLEGRVATANETARECVFPSERESEKNTSSVSDLFAFSCSDALFAPLGENAKVVVLTSQCWDEALKTRVASRLASHLTVGALVVDYGDSLKRERAFGEPVAVVEAHYVAGGAAHGFVRDDFHFDAGPSYFLGLSSPPGESINGLRQVLDAVGETLPRGAAVYNSLKMYFPDGNFECVADRECYRDAIRRFAGDDAVKEWDALEEAMTPLGDAAVAIPFAGMRADSGVVLTMAKYVAPLVKALGGGPKGAEGFEDAKWLRENFSALVDTHVRNEWLRRLLDLRLHLAQVAINIGDTDQAAAQLTIVESQNGANQVTQALWQKINSQERADR